MKSGDQHCASKESPPYTPVKDDFSGLSPVRGDEWDKVIALAYDSYAPATRLKVEASLMFHRRCRAAGLDDGRIFLAWREHGEIVGVCGVQRRTEDPATVAWASWFFVIHRRRGSAVAHRMSYALRIWLRLKGFKRLYIETSNCSRYYNIDSMLRKMGFTEVSRIGDFFEPDAASLIFEGDVEVLSQRNTTAPKSLLPIRMDDVCGLFCDYAIGKGEPILNLRKPYLPARSCTPTQTSPAKDAESAIGMYINHNVNPNAVVTSDALIVSACDISPGTEITLDHRTMRSHWHTLQSSNQD